MRFNKENWKAAMMKQGVRVASLSVLFTVLGVAGIYPPNPGDMTVSIPFDFVAGGQSLRAGEYIVRNEADKGTLQICEDGIYCVTVQTQAVGAAQEASAQMQLVFQQYGDQRLLARIWSPRHGGIQLTGTPHANQVASAGLVRETCVKARELCFHTNKGFTPTWH